MRTIKESYDYDEIKCKNKQSKVNAIVKDIKNEFPDVHSIWKEKECNIYYAKFYDEGDNVLFRIKKSIKIQMKYGINTSIRILTLDLEDKEATINWMYYGYELLWMSDNNSN